MWQPKKDKNLQIAIMAYLSRIGYRLAEDEQYEIMIDGVDVFVDGKPVLEIGLPPVSNYSIKETKYTRELLQKAPRELRYA